MSNSHKWYGCALKLGFAETAGLSFKFPTANLTFKLGGARFARGRVGPFGTGLRMTTGMPVPLPETLLCSMRFLTATATAHFVPARNPKLQLWPCLPLACGENHSGDDDSFLQDSIAIRRKVRLQSTMGQARNGHHAQEKTIALISSCRTYLGVPLTGPPLRISARPLTYRPSITGPE